MERSKVWKEEETMTPELQRAFDKLERLNQEEHTKTRTVAKDIETRLNLHLIESAVSRAKMEEHLLDHRAKAKWIWSLAAGVILALCAAGAALLTRFIK